jgi:GNAT superfamily N-acetyltransferase
MLSAQTDPDQILTTLRRRPLANVVLLKFLTSRPDGVRVHQLVSGDRVATLLLIDHAFSEYDLATYPDAHASAIIASDEPEMTRSLLPFVQRDRVLVFKLGSDDDRVIVEEAFPMERRTSFISYTSTDFSLTGETARIGTAAADAPFHLFAAQGHRAAWLQPLMERGEAFTSTAEVDGECLSGCFAFKIDGDIWEIGGVYTLPEARGRGLARGVVQAALAELKRRGLVPRYQVEDTNLPSSRLAEALGMTRFLTLTHYISATVAGR